MNTFHEGSVLFKCEGRLPWGFAIRYRNLWKQNRCVHRHGWIHERSCLQVRCAMPVLYQMRHRSPWPVWPMPGRSGDVFCWKMVFVVPLFILGWETSDDGPHKKTTGESSTKWYEILHCILIQVSELLESFLFYKTVDELFIFCSKQTPLSTTGG